MKKSADDWSIKILIALQGAVIGSPVISENGECFGFRTNAKGKEIIVWIDCDEEGNGPGALFIEEFTPEDVIEESPDEPTESTPTIN